MIGSVLKFVSEVSCSAEKSNASECKQVNKHYQIEYQIAEKAFYIPCDISRYIKRQIRSYLIPFKFDDNFQLEILFSSHSDHTQCITSLVQAVEPTTLATARHYLTRADEHLRTDLTSAIYKHLDNNPHCKRKCNTDCFSILDNAQTSFSLGVKEALYVAEKKPAQKISYKMKLLLQGALVLFAGRFISCMVGKYGDYFD